MATKRTKTKNVDLDEPQLSSNAHPFTGGAVVGHVIMIDLDLVKPNGWNPNEMTADEFAGLKHGMKTRGWLANHSLLVWGTNEKGKRQDVIIDGEHRWDAARQLGFTKGPAVYINGITKAQAMALTVELDKKRGRFNDEKLSEVVMFLHENLGVENLGIELGFTDAQLKTLLDEDVPDGEGPAPSLVSAKNERQVPLFFDAATYDVFMRHIETLSKRHEGKLSDLVFMAVSKEAGA